MSLFPEPEAQQPEANPFSALAGKAGSMAMDLAISANPFTALMSQGVQALQPEVPAAPKMPAPPPDNNPIVEIGDTGFSGHFWAAENLQKAFNTLKEKGLGYAINSGFRTKEDQAALFAKYGPGRAAAPGHSNHEKGWSFDLDVDDAAAELLEEFGFARPLSHEPWHFTFQPGLPEGASERVWKDDDPRMRRFKQGDNYLGTPRHLAQSLAAQEGFNQRDQSLLLRMWNQESGFNPEAVSPAGAIGIGQIMPGNLAPLLLKIGATPEEYRKSPAVQIRASLEFMQGLLRQYDGNWAQALAAYNGGPGAVDYAVEKGFFPSSGDPSAWSNETLSYVSNIMGTSRDTAMTWISGRAPGPKAKLPEEGESTRAVQGKVREQARVWGSYLMSFLGENNPYQGLFESLGQDPGQTPGWVPPGGPQGSAPQGPQLAQGGAPAGDAPLGAPSGPGNIMDEMQRLFAPQENGQPLQPAGEGDDGTKYFYNGKGQLVTGSGKVFPPGFILAAGKTGGLKPVQAEAGIPAISPNVPLLGPTQVKAEGQTWGQWVGEQALDVGEVGKTFLRGVVGGVLGAKTLWAHMFGSEEQVPGLGVGTALKEVVTNPVDIPGAVGRLGSRAVREATGEDIPDWANQGLAEHFLKLLQPEKEGRHERIKREARNVLNINEDSGLLEWLWAPTDAPIFGSGGTLEAKAAVFASELPYLAGMEVMAQALGPAVGATRGLARRERESEFIAQAMKKKASRTGPSPAGVVDRTAEFVEAVQPATRKVLERAKQKFRGKDEPGSRIMGGLMGRPEGGKITEFTGVNSVLGLGGTGTYKVLARIPGVRNFANKMGQNFFEEMSIWGSINAGQMMAEVGGLSVLEGKNPQEAAADAIGAGIMGYLAGSAFGLGVPVLGLGASTLARPVVDMSANLGVNTLRAFSRWEGRHAVGKSILGVVHALDSLPGTKKGWFSERVLGVSLENLEVQSTIRRDASRAATSRATSLHADQLDFNARTIRESVQRVTTRAEEVQKALGTSQANVERMEQVNPRLPEAAESLRALEENQALWAGAKNAWQQARRGMNKGGEEAQKSLQAQNEWLNTYGQTLGFKDHNEFLVGLRKSEKDYAEGIANFQRDTGVSEGDVRGYLGEQEMLSQLQTQMDSFAQDPAFANRAELEKHAEVFEWTASRVRAFAKAFESGSIPTSPRVSEFSPVPNDIPAEHRAAYALRSQDEFVLAYQRDKALEGLDPEAVVRAQEFEEGLQSILNAGLANDPVTAPLHFHTLRYMRSMLESDTGSVSSRLQNTLDALDLEIKGNADAIRGERLRLATEHRLAKGSKPPKSKEFTDPEYAKKMEAAEKQAEAAGDAPGDNDFIRDRIADIRRLELQQKTLKTELDRVQLLDRVSDPEAPRKAVVQGLKEEIVRGMDEEVRAAGFKGGLKEVEGLLSRKAVPASEIAKKYRRANKLPKAPSSYGMPKSEIRAGRARLAESKPLRPEKGAPTEEWKAWRRAKARWNKEEKAFNQNRKKRFLAAQERVRQFRETESGPHAVLTEEIHNNKAYVLLQDLPEDWVPTPKGVGDPPVRMQAVEGNDPIILRRTANGKLEALAGADRLVARRAAGGPVQAWIPKKDLHSHIKGVLEARTQPDTHDYFFPREVYLNDVIPDSGNFLDIPKGQGLLSPREAIDAWVDHNLSLKGLTREEALKTPEGAKKIVDLESYIMREIHRGGPGTTVYLRKGMATFDPLEAANEQFSQLRPETQARMLEEEFHKLTQDFLEAEIPSLKSYRTLFGITGDGIPDDPGLSKEANSLVADLKMMGDQFAHLRYDLETLNERSPKTIGGMMMRGFNTLSIWAHKTAAARRVSDHVGAEFRKSVIDALGLRKTAVSKTAKFFGGDEYTGVDIPLPLRERMVDALESLSTDSGAMRSLLQEYPELRDSFGAYFRLAQEWEKLKINSPEMGTFFRDNVVFHTYPTMRQIFKSVSLDPKNKVPFTRLASEFMRTIPTLAEARVVYNKALTKLLSGEGWSGVTTPLKDAAERETYFLNADIGERGMILGIDPMTEGGRKAINLLTIHLGLKNPITDPAVVIQNHIKAAYAADSTRQLLKDLASVHVPGMKAINPETGRPYSIVEYSPSQNSLHPVTGKPVASMGGPVGLPAVPSLRARVEGPGMAEGKLSNYVTFSTANFGMDPNTRIKFGGTEVLAGDLYIHADVAELINDRFLASDSLVGGDFGKILQDVGELLRAGQLIGAPGAHAANILTDFWIGLGADALMGMSSGRYSIAEAGKLILKSPFEAMGMGAAGERMAASELGPRMFLDAQLHGANFNTWDQWTRSASEAAISLVEEEMGYRAANETRAGKIFSELVKKDESAGEFWNRTRDTRQLLGEGTGTERSEAALKLLVSGGLNLDYWANNYSVFNPIKHSMLAGYHYWTAMNWKDMGQKLIAEGHTPAAAMRMCKSAAAEYVNTLCGTVSQSADPSVWRKLVYSPMGMVGPIGATAPGWYRAKVNALLSPLDRVLEGGQKYLDAKTGAAPGENMPWGRAARYGEESPAYRDYVRSRWETTLAYGLAASWASLQVFNTIVTGNPTFNHPDPDMRYRIQMGTKAIAWPFQGMYRDLFNAAAPAIQGDVSKVLKAVLMNPTLPFPTKVGTELATNNAALFRGGDQPIYSKEKTTDPWTTAGKMVDIAGYSGARLFSGPLETMGLEDPAGNAQPMGLGKWAVQATTGVRLSEYDLHKRSRRAVDERTQIYQEQTMQRLRPLLRRAIKNGDFKAEEELQEWAVYEGVPVRPEDEDLFPGGRYKVSSETFKKMVEAETQQWSHYGEGLSKQERIRYHELVDKHEVRSKKTMRGDFVRAMTKKFFGEGVNQ